MAKKSLETIRNLINKYGGAKIKIKIPKSKFKLSKSTHIKI